MPWCLQTNLNTIPWCSKELQPSCKTCFQHVQPIHKVIWSEYFRLLNNSVWFWATCHNSIIYLLLPPIWRTLPNHYQRSSNWFQCHLGGPSQNSTSFQVFESIFAAETAVMWPKSGHVSFVDGDRQTKNTKIWKLWKVKALFGMATCPRKKRHFAVQHKTFIRLQSWSGMLRPGSAVLW